MLKTATFTYLLLFSSTCFGSIAAELTHEQALVLAENQDQNIFVYFNASWCLPCKLAKEGLLSDDKIKRTLDQDFVKVEVDIDNTSQKDWLDGYKACCLPHFQILDKTGIILKEISGNQPIDLFYNQLIKYAKPRKITTELIAEKIRSRSSKATDLNLETQTTPKNKNKVASMIPNILKTISVGAFAIEANVNKLLNKLKDSYGYDLYIDKTDNGLFRLNIGTFYSDEECRWILDELKKNKIAHYVRTIK